MKGYFNKIKFLVMDVDGTLTDGKIYMGDKGEMIKSFDIKDGYAIKKFLPKLGIIPVIITARKSDILFNRCQELDILEVHQGVINKFEKLKEILLRFSEKGGVDYTFENVAYVGDDNLDIQCMTPIKNAGGLAVCPSDAAKDVISIADFISIQKGGDGAIREFVEWIRSMKLNNNPKLEKVKELSPAAYDFIINFAPSKKYDGKYDLGNGIYANVMSYYTKDASMAEFESHRKYIDIQYLIYGSEIIMTESTEKIENYALRTYDEKNDIQLYDYKFGKVDVLNSGEIVILYPNDAHKGAISVDKLTSVRKIVVKIPVK